MGKSVIINSCLKWMNNTFICFRCLLEQPIYAVYQPEDDPLAINGDEETVAQEGNKSIKADPISISEEQEKSSQVHFTSALVSKDEKVRSEKSPVRSLVIKVEEELQVRKHVDPTLGEPSGENEIDLFFKAMAATVKKFCPADRTEAKMKIFSIVNEIETRKQRQYNSERSSPLESL